jgi:hypothetical protein
MKLFDILKGIEQGISEGDKNLGVYLNRKEQDEERKAKRTKREKDEAQADLNQRIQVKKLEHLIGEPDRKKAAEQDKRTQETTDNLAKADLLEYYLDQYVSNKKKALSGISAFGVGDVNISGTDAFEANKIAENFQQPLTGLLASMDNLGKTQKIFEKFTEAESARTVSGIESVGKAIKSQIKGMKASILSESGLPIEEAKNLNQNARERFSEFKNYFDGQTQEQETPDVPEKRQRLSQELEDLIQEENTPPLEPDSKESAFDIRERNHKKILDAYGDPEVWKESKNTVMDTISGAKALGDGFGDYVKNVPLGIALGGSKLAKLLTGKDSHEYIDKVTQTGRSSYEDFSNIKNPDSLPSKAGRFQGELTTFNKASPTPFLGLKGMDGAIADGAIYGAAEDPENPLRGAGIGSVAGGFLHKALGVIATVPQSAKKWWLKWAKGKSHNSPEIAERLSKNFTGDEVSLGQLLDSPGMIQKERTMGHVPFSGASKNVDSMIQDLERVSEDIAVKFEKNPTLVSKEIQESESYVNKVAKEEYKKALGIEAEELVLSPKDVNELLTNNYGYRPDIKHKVVGEKTLSNETLVKRWEEHQKMLENLWNSGNKEAYTKLYRNLQMPNFWDLHWFGSDLNKTALKLKRAPKIDSNTRSGLHNDEITFNTIVKNYDKNKEYKAATELYKEVVSPFKDLDLSAFHLDIAEGKTPNFNFFEKGGDKAKKIYEGMEYKGSKYGGLSSEAKNAVLADVIDPQAEKLSLRSFPEKTGRRGNKASSKTKHLLTEEEKLLMEDYGQLNRMLSDLQPEQKSPKTGYALLKAAKNPAAAAGSIVAGLFNPTAGMATGSGMAVNRLLAKSLRSRKNLKHYLKPELLDEIIRKKKLKHRHRLPMQILSSSNREEDI